ncbi:MAG: hypothetical protein H6780_01560 [Candidatus Nomurabacteria bacterium]|nr:MAG: hypothetical protein H6780_01560 [Candidatus Nomurabacteria bacterium]
MKVTQLSIPDLTDPAPNFWDHLLSFFDLEFWRQEIHVTKATVLSTRYRDGYSCVVGSSPLGGRTTAYIPPAHLIKVRTPHGDTEVKISKALFDITTPGDTLPVSYQKSRLYVIEQHIRARIAV